MLHTLLENAMDEVKLQVVCFVIVTISTGIGMPFVGYGITKVLKWWCRRR